MGDIYKTTCPKCNYQKSFFLGGGLTACDPNAIISEFSPELTKAFFTAFENKTLTGFNFSRKLGFCPNCHDYFETPTLHFETSQKISSTISQYCPHCHNKLRISTPTTITCPKCDESLSLALSGHWD